MAAMQISQVVTISPYVLWRIFNIAVKQDADTCRQGSTETNGFRCSHQIISTWRSCFPTPFEHVCLSWVFLVFYVTCNKYVTVQMCRRTKKLYLRSGSQRHRHFAGFLNVSILHRHGTTLSLLRWRFKKRKGPPYPQMGRVSRNYRKKVGPVSVLGRTRKRTIWNV